MLVGLSSASPEIFEAFANAGFIASVRGTVVDTVDAQVVLRYVSIGRVVWGDVVFAVAELLRTHPQGQRLGGRPPESSFG